MINFKKRLEEKFHVKGKRSKTSDAYQDEFDNEFLKQKNEYKKFNHKASRNAKRRNSLFEETSKKHSS